VTLPLGFPPLGIARTQPVHGELPLLPPYPTTQYRSSHEVSCGQARSLRSLNLKGWFRCRTSCGRREETARDPQRLSSSSPPPPPPLRFSSCPLAPRHLAREISHGLVCPVRWQMVPTGSSSLGPGSSTSKHNHSNHTRTKELPFKPGPIRRVD
jgi:hypothetical protein